MRVRVEGMGIEVKVERIGVRVVAKQVLALRL